MTFDEAKAHLGDAIKPDGRLYSLGWYLCYEPHITEDATLDGQFTADDLEAIAVYMREYGSLKDGGTQDQ